MAEWKGSCVDPVRRRALYGRLRRRWRGRFGATADGTCADARARADTHIDRSARSLYARRREHAVLGFSQRDCL